MSEIRRVPLLDLTRFDADYAAEITEAFERVFRSGHYILGPEVDAFEEECAAYIGAKHAIGVSSGSDALLVALMAIGVGVGDEVICPTYTFFATAGAVWRTGAKPVFVDIDLRTYNLDPDDVARKITSKTKAILPVHLFGQCSDMGSVRDLANAHDLVVVEDAAQAIGSRYQGQCAGTLGNIGCFSFFPTKNLGAFGDGGLVTSNDPELATKVRRLRVHGGHPKYYHQVVGGNFRIDSLQAALLRVKLKRLDDATTRRQTNALLYNRLFQEADLAADAADDDDEHVENTVRFHLPAVVEENHIYNQYVVRISGDGTRDEVRGLLAERGVGTEIYYPVPLHLQECFKPLGHREGDFPISEKAARESLALPIFPELAEDEIRYVVDQLAAFWPSSPSTAC